jgi:hypothetical protein
LVSTSPSHFSSKDKYINIKTKTVKIDPYHTQNIFITFSENNGSIRKQENIFEACQYGLIEDNWKTKQKPRWKNLSLFAQKLAFHT